MEHTANFEAATSADLSFSIERKPLYDALEMLRKRVIDKRSTTALACVRIDAMPGAIRLTGTDFDLELSIDLPADVERVGSVALNCATLSTIVKKADKSADIRLSVNDGRALVAHGRARQNLPTGDIDQFPVVCPPIGGNVNTFTLSGEFVQSLAMVAPFVSNGDDRREYLCGVAVQAREGVMALVANDGQSMSFVEMEAPEGSEGTSAILPSKALAALASLASASELIMEAGGKGAEISGDNWRLVTKYCAGEYPDWRRVIPTGEMEGVFMPELAPNLAPSRVEAFKKAIVGGLSWEIGMSCGDVACAMIKSADHPNWTGVLASTQYQVPRAGYAFEGVTVERDGVSYPVATNAKGIGLSADVVRALCGTPEELAAMQARHDGLEKARKSLSYPKWGGKGLDIDPADPAYLYHVERCNAVTSMRKAFEAEAARGGDAEACLAAAYAVNIVADAEPVTPLSGECEAETSAPPPIGAQCEGGRGFFIFETATDKAIAYFPDYSSAKAAHDAMEPTPSFPEKVWPHIWRFMITAAVSKNDCRDDLVAQTAKYFDDVAAISAPQTPQEAQEPVSAPQIAPEAEIAPCDDLAGDMAALSVAPSPNGAGFVVIDQAGVVMAGPFWTQWQAAAAMDDLSPPSGGIADAAPLSGELKAKRTPAHERAIRLAWAMRKAARLQRDIAADHMRMREQVQASLASEMAIGAKTRATFWKEQDKRRRAIKLALSLRAQLQAARADDESKAILRKSRDEARAMAITGREKRRKAVLFARGLQKRLSGEYRLNDRLRDQKRDAFKRLAQETNARLAAENAMAAIEARMNGWPPAVRSLSVNFRKAA